MRYRTKILLVLLFLAMATGGAVMALYFWQARQLLHAQIQSRALAAATNAAMAIDGDLHRLALVEGEDSAAFQEILQRMRQLRDANRREDHFVRFFYTIVPDATGEGWVFVVDAEEAPEHRSLPGEPMLYEGGGGVLLQLDRPVVESAFSYDTFGTWLSAYAPVRDASGTPVALLGLDLEAHRIEAKLGRLLGMGWIALAGGLAVASALAMLIGRWATRPLAEIERAVQRIGEGNWEKQLVPKGNDEFAQLSLAVNRMAAALRDRENLKQALTRYVSQSVAEKILEHNSLPRLEGERRLITVLLVDIRNFSRLAEKLSAEAVVEFLNRYFSVLIDLIFEHNGTLDKFLGDGLMVVFGAPLPDDAHALHAVQTAEAILQRVEAMSGEMERAHQFPLRVGIGIHTGEAIVGNIGSEERMEYTAIGSSVNVAFRLEAATKELGVPLLLSPSVRQQLLATRVDIVPAGSICIAEQEEEVFTLASLVDDGPSSAHRQAG